MVHAGTLTAFPAQYKFRLEGPYCDYICARARHTYWPRRNRKTGGQLQVSRPQAWQPLPSLSPTQMAGNEPNITLAGCFTTREMTALAKTNGRLDGKIEFVDCLKGQTPHPMATMFPAFCQHQCHNWVITTSQ